MRRWLKRAGWLLAGLAGAVLLVLVAGILVVRSDWFREKVRQRLIAEVERSSGGRTEIGSFHYNWKTLTFSLRPFVLHGAEAPGEEALFRCDELRVRVKILSAWRRDVHLESAIVDRPLVHVIVYPDGSTNLPRPKIPPPSSDVAATLLKLAIGHFEMRNGRLRFADREIPLQADADDLEARLDYDATVPRYTGRLDVGALRLAGAGFGPLVSRVAAELSLVHDRLEFPHVTLDLGKSRVEVANGALNLRSGEMTGDLKGHLLLAETGKPLRVPIAHRGQVDFTGQAFFRGGQDYSIAVRVAGLGLAVEEPPVRVAGIALNADVTATAKGLWARGLEVAASGSRFRGQAAWPDWRRFEVSGQVTNLATDDVNRVQSAARLTYAGIFSGPVELRGELAGARLRGLTLEARLHIEPGPGPHPVRGDVEALWLGDRRTLRLGDSHIALSSSTISVAGTLGERVAVHLGSTNLDDFLPAIDMAGAVTGQPGAPPALPLKLASNGSLRFDGEVTGPLEDPRITGHARLTAFSIEGRNIDRLESAVALGKSSVALTDATLEQGAAQVHGSLELGLVEWKPRDSSRLRASLEVAHADLARLAAQAGVTSPVTGTLDANLDATGTFGAPEGTLKLVVRKPSAYGETFNAARGEVRFTAATVEVVNGLLELGPARLTFSGTYHHAPADWSSGEVRFTTAGSGFTLAQFHNLEQIRPGVGGRASLRASGTATLRKGDFLLTSLNGEAALNQLTLDSRPIGNLVLGAKTSAGELAVSATGDLRGAKVSGSGQWRLEGQYPGQGQLSVAAVDLGAIYDLVSATEGGKRRPLPAGGLVEASLTFSGPARQPGEMRVRLEIPRLLVRPADTRDRTAEEIQDLTLRNAEPIVVDLDRNTAQVRSAKFTGKDTNLEIGGAVALNEKNSWDLKIKGNLNLAALGDFNSDIEASGRSVLDAQVRGTLANPQLNGSVELQDIAANLRGVPTGIDKGNGVILFQNNRAVIRKMTAEVGGGKLSFSGFIGLGGGEAVYRLQANADNVRVRSEGVSITVTSVINLAGTTSASLLSGDITVRKAGFTPKTDVGGLLAQYSRPLQTPAAPNEILRNMQLDVHIDTAPGLMFQTSLTKDIQAEADLRLRGTAAKPSLLGHMTVNQGEINFFGGDYQINRGDILFLNPAKIEPVLNLDLQTEARGVTVTINFSGTLNKMNISYRSDPPLQSSEIIALLAVGRDPGVNPALASSQITTSQSVFATGANTILGQAVTAPVSSRLERFFGVSRLKIDPMLTDVTNIPQARLTLEQQISKDITLTYITNLNKTQEQIVRLQWDLSRRWSLIAIRDENGLFGIDFQYRTRFK